MSAFKFIFLGVLAITGIEVQAQVKVLLDEDFESGVLKTPGLGIGQQSGGLVEISRDASQQVNAKSTAALKATYPVGTGGIYGWASFDMTPYKSYEVYVEFNAKMPKAKQGLKFLKVFGERGGTAIGVANTTFGLDYTGVASGKGSLIQIGFGDGKTIDNDVQNVINLDGTYPSWIGRSYGKAVVKTPENKGFIASEWDDTWHHFRIKVKFNSATKNADGTYQETNDGEYFLQIDGKTYVDAKGLFNRNPANGPIVKVALLDWSQNIDEPFEIWYDNVRITTGGFYTENDPSNKNMKPLLK